MDKDQKEKNGTHNSDSESSCCSGNQTPSEPAPCCCGQPAPVVRKTRKSPSIRTLISCIIILAAMGVAAHALFTGGYSGTAVLAEQPENPGIDAASSCQKLDSLAGLNKLAGDKDFVFVMLGGDADSKTQNQVDQTMAKAMEKLAEQKISVANFNLRPGGSDYKSLVQRFGVEKFPVVVAIGKGCGKVAVVNDITLENLIAGYKQAMKPGCNPHACGITR